MVSAGNHHQKSLPTGQNQNFPQAGPGEMDWAALGNCCAQQWPDLRREAVLHEAVHARARLASSPSCQPRPRESHGGKPTRVFCRARSKKNVCLALEGRIFFLYDGFLRVGLPKINLTPIVCGVPHSIALADDLSQVLCLHPGSYPHPGSQAAVVYVWPQNLGA